MGLQRLSYGLPAEPRPARAWPQILADITGAPIVLADYANWAALGGAALAGWGSGVFPSLEEAIRRLQPTVRRVLPNPGLSELYSCRTAATAAARAVTGAQGRTRVAPGTCRLERSSMNKRRLRRIFRSDGHTLIVACDHGMIAGPDAGIEDLGRTLAQVIAGGVDAVMASYGTATRFAEQLADVGSGAAHRRRGLCARPGWWPRRPVLHCGGRAAPRRRRSLRHRFPRHAVEETTLTVLAHVIREAHAWGIPVMAEMVPGGFDSAPVHRSPAQRQA